MPKFQKKSLRRKTASAKITSLDAYTEHPENSLLTTNHGVKINDDQNTLKAGNRGPSLLEDFIMREKITHFDHERIPERIVNARGSKSVLFLKYSSLPPRNFDILF